MHTLGSDKNSINCSQCGVYMFRYHNVFGVKTRRFAESQPIRPRSYLLHLRKESKRFRQLTEVHLNDGTHTTLKRLLAKFRLGDDTLALGLYLYYVLFMNSVKGPDQEGKLATGCLYEACKIKEGSKHLNLPRFRKHSNGSFAPEEFCELEH